MRSASISVVRRTPEGTGECLLEGAKESCGCAEDAHPAPDEPLWLEGVGSLCESSFRCHISADEPSLAKVTLCSCTLTLTHSSSAWKHETIGKTKKPHAPVLWSDKGWRREIAPNPRQAVLCHHVIQRPKIRLLSAVLLPARLTSPLWLQCG